MLGSQPLHMLCICSAYKNKGVQLLLDGVTTYLPSPLDVTNRALDVNNNQAPLDLPSSCQASQPSMSFAWALCLDVAYLLLHNCCSMGWQVNTRTGATGRQGWTWTLHLLVCIS